MPHFLFEIGFEEMPARFLSGLSSEIETLVRERLGRANAPFTDVATFATPRRLVVSIPDLAGITAKREELVTGPPERIAYGEDGTPTKAAAGFAKTQGVDLSDAFIHETDKGRYLAVNKTTGGEEILSLLPAVCMECVNGLSFPKKMRWGSREFTFGRPVHWFLALLDDAVVPFEIEGAPSGRETRGHRVMGPGPFALETAADYFDVVRDKGKIMLSADERRAYIVDRARALAAEAGGRAVIPGKLLEEVCGLTEHPVVVLASFDEKFLKVPREVLLTSMESHQKSFGVENDKGELLPCFLTTLGLTPKDVDLVRKGWERVLTARLEDARFFWETDLDADMDAWVAKLDNVVFLAGLGSMGDKSRRLESLCGRLAEASGHPEHLLDMALAGRLAKADLVSEMVIEFDKVQGIMGGVYAKRKGRSDNVAAALREQYLPAGPDSPAPSTLFGALLSLADKADTMAGCFGLDMIPTGAADPYALRRAALGISRIIIEHELRLDLEALFDEALANYGDVAWKLAPAEAKAKLLDFTGQRLKAWFTGRGEDTLVVEAALGAGFADVYELSLRIKALAAFAKSDAFEQAVLAFKRAANIIRKQGAEAGRDLTGEIDEALLAEDAEKALAATFADMFPLMDALLEKDDFDALLALLHELRPSVDAFFDNVMVMCDDPDLRLNRLNLLKALVDRLARVADFAALQV